MICGIKCTPKFYAMPHTLLKPKVFCSNQKKLLDLIFLKLAFSKLHLLYNKNQENQINLSILISKRNK